MTENVLIIGAGGVGSAVAHKCAQHNAELGDICIAARTTEKCEQVVSSVQRMGNVQDSAKALDVAEVDATDSQAVAGLIERSRASMVLNVASPYCNLGVIDACLATGAHYLDTAVYEVEGQINVPPPWYANHEWKYRDRFRDAGITGVLGIGFDPGAVNAFCAYADKHLFDTIESIDIMDVNAGDHGRFFATNFDPETNLREIMEDVLFWERGRWQRIPYMSKSRVYDFPVVGEHRVYSMGHDEIHSISQNIDAGRVEFWMAFNDRYMQVFETLEKLGLLSPAPVDVEGTPVVPLKVLKAVLPDPASLAQGYTGEVCIGCLVKGTREGEPREVFVYTTCDHTECYREVGSQAISYTTAVPMVTAALLVARGDWRVNRLVNVEELDPDPFMALMPEIGLGWNVRDGSR